MALLSLENNVLSRVGYDSGSRFADTVFLADLDSNGNIGAGNTILRQDRLSLVGDTSDPDPLSLVGGDVWYRSDTGDFKYYNGAWGMMMTFLHDQSQFGGDVSGVYNGITNLQLDCPNAEQYPGSGSKLRCWVDEAFLPTPMLYFTYLDSSGLTQYYASLPLTPVP